MGWRRVVLLQPPHEVFSPFDISPHPSRPNLGTIGAQFGKTAHDWLFARAIRLPKATSRLDFRHFAYLAGHGVLRKGVQGLPKLSNAANQGALLLSPTHHRSGSTDRWIPSQTKTNPRAVRFDPTRVLLISGRFCLRCGH